jgi:hypothetical protein
MRKTLGKVKNLMPCSCEDLQIPQSINALQYLFLTFRSSSRDTLARLAVALEWREE